MEIIIIGAGISGLIAGKILNQAGHSVIILEKSSGVGGRMATRRFKGVVADHGAQFFTVRDASFQSWVESWTRRGVAQVWSCNFSGSNGKPGEHPRYMGIGGMTSIAKHLAKGQKIYLNHQVKSISYQESSWVIHSTGGEQFTARYVLLTAPVPQSLQMLTDTHSFLSSTDYNTLSAIQYHPCIATILLIDGPSRVPPPGGLKLEKSSIQWLADNNQKGISTGTTSLTIHASVEFSRENFQRDPGYLAESLIEQANPWLGGQVLDWQIHKWRYSHPNKIYPKRFYQSTTLSNLYFAGDGFGGPRIEGAALSGISAAHHLLERE